MEFHKDGKGPFCRFTIPRDLHAGGVYVLTENDRVVYVGETFDLARRLNTGYGHIYQRNRFKGGRMTNCRVNHHIYESVIEQRKHISLWFCPTQGRDARKALENALTSRFDRLWNR